MNAIPRPEHPRPDFMRDTYVNLNGTWQFAFDDEDQGNQEHWYAPGHPLPLRITVPFAYQCQASGIGDEKHHPVIWYRRIFTVPLAFNNRNVLLHFGAVDHACTVYVNGQMAGEHIGGYLPFSMDITHLLKEGDNDLCVRAEDTMDCSQLRGKQYWGEGLMGCWYTPVSGIWQTVYMEAVGAYALRQIHITPDIDLGCAHVEIALNHTPSAPVILALALSFKGQLVKTLTVSTVDRHTRVPLNMTAKGNLAMFKLWWPSEPNLYDLSVRVINGDVEEDHVSTYFGMRKVEIVDGQVLLNHTPFYQRLVLDQGYWPDSLTTPPTDEAIRKDIELTLAMGFNGARKHQKIEDPRYYYWADRLGLVVWGEVPSPYDFTDETISHLMETFKGFIDRDFNHPCIIAWAPLNESWGVPQIYTNKRQQATGRMLYHIGKAADGTRLISSNDGWEHVITDICGLHDYAISEEVMAKHFQNREHVEKTACDFRMAYVQNEKPTGQEAFMVTEFGGIAFSSIGFQGEMGGIKTWGYHDKVTDDTAFLKRFSGVVQAVLNIPYNQGYCYTQLTDVMQEINGLLTPERTPKIATEIIQTIVTNPLGTFEYKPGT